MVRTISAASQAKLDQNLGTEPALIIEIQWVDGGSIYRYSDKDISNTEGKILQVSGLDNTVVVQGVKSGTSGDSQQISVTLDDTDGTIKDIIDSHDIHKEPAWVYQWFDSLDVSERFLIFKGQISSPIQWNEGDRTVSFDIITRIEDAEVGFSMEEGNFDYVPEELVGEPWPLVFGTVRCVPALRTRSPRKGILRTGFGIRDYMLAPKKEQVDFVCCPWRFIGFRAYYENTGSGGAWGAGNLRILPVYEKDVNCECKKRAIQCEMDRKIAIQSQFEYSTVEIIDGEFFPQGVFIRLDIGGAIVSGQFTGTESSPTNVFQIANRIHPKLVQGDPEIPPITDFGCDPKPDGQQNDTGGGANLNSQVCVLPEDCGGWGSQFYFNNIVEQTSGTKEQAAWDYLSTFEEAGFYWAEPGSEVTLDGDNELVYVANILPSTVHYVKAYKTFRVSGLRQLTTVPNDYYTVRFSDFGSYTTTEVVFDRPLSQRGEGWEDDIFVTLTSTVGPNPVDIMEWLIDKYTSFTWDASFADVKTKVDKYPMNFVVPGRMNILKLLQEMSFQGRMALALREDEFTLTYLSEEPSEDGTITEDDVIANTLVLDHTDTEDLVTKFVAEWRPDACLEEPYKVILRYNIKRYGTQEETFDFYCYNIQELVIKSATFWLIRMANTWRKVVCQTPINKLALETLDGCFVTLPDIANGTIKCRVETAVYNSENNSIDFVLQTPVRSGERDAFDFHYPANISVELLHPTDEALELGNAGGSGPNVDVEAPEGHVLGRERQLLSGFTFGQKSPCESFSGDQIFNRPIDLQNRCRPDQGDQQPSDIDDTKPSVQLQSDNSVIPPSQSPVNEQSEEIINETIRDYQQEGRNGDMGTQINNNLNTGTGSKDGAGSSGGAGAGGSTSNNVDDMLDALEQMPEPDELTDQNKCWFGLKVFYINPVITVQIPNGTTCDGDLCEDPEGWCYCGEDGKTGCVVGNVAALTSETFSFGTIEERNEFATEILRIRSSPGTVGSPHPAFVQTQEYNPAGVCQPVADDAAGGIIGYSREGDRSGTVVGYKGFMSDAYDPDSEDLQDCEPGVSGG